MSSEDEVKRDEATLTTGWGSPVVDNMNSATAGQFGPVLLQVRHHRRHTVPMMPSLASHRVHRATLCL